MVVSTSDILISLLRWNIGLICGSILGMFLFLVEIMPLFKRLYLKSTLDFFRAIPIIGLVPLIQILIGVKEYGKIGLIAWGVMFPVWIAVRSAFKKDLPNAELMLLGAKISKRELLRLYTIPRVLGGFIKGVEIGIGIGWLCVVASEWIGTFSDGFWSGGIGYRLIVEQDNANWHGVLQVLLIFGFLGTLTSFLWSRGIRFFFNRNMSFNPLK